MIGTKFYKPLEMDKLTRTVIRTVTREEEVQVAVPVEREYTHTVQDPVYKTMTADDGTQVQVVVGFTEREVTEKVQDVEYRTEKRTVTEDVPEQEEYDNPAPNTLTKYREAAQWCNKNQAYIEDKGKYYEVVALPEPTPEELAAALQVQYTALIQSMLDKEAQKLGYDNCNSVCTYVDTGVQKFDDEGRAFRAWRSAVWAKGYEILDSVKAGEVEIPTEEELITFLPTLEIVYTDA